MTTQDLTGRTAVVTGANAGLGFHTASALAARGAHVVLACRNTAAATKAAASMQGTTRVEQLDLSSLASVADFAARWEGPLDLLVNNAGVMNPPQWEATHDGFERQFGVNHLAHVALTARLLPALLASGAGRVVTVSSIAHHAGSRSVLQGNPREGYRPNAAYGNSKLANLLFARELHVQATAAGAPLTSVACHPGVAATALFSSPDGAGARAVVRLLAPLAIRVVAQSPEAGARSSIEAATTAAPGSYLGPQWLRETRGPVGPARLSACARDLALQAAVWDDALARTGVTFAF